jgi:DNA-binding NarL/FixJ family response regulator
MLEQARAAFPGAHVDTAGSVVEAIERGSVGVDIVMLDLGLPGCAGIEALTRMRAAYPEARIVVVSATEERAVILAARQMQVLRLLSRGLGNKEIAQSLRIAKDTVKQHAKAVYAALGVTGRTAERRGIKFDR